MSKSKRAYVVLADGETFSPLEGCIIVKIDDAMLTDEQRRLLDYGDIQTLLNECCPPAVETYPIAEPESPTKHQTQVEP